MSESEDTRSNVYAAPKADLEIIGDDAVLAERKDRFLAAIIDGVIGLLVGLPIVFLAGPYLGFDGLGSQPGYQYLIPATIFGFIMFVLIHGYLLSKYGQTVGKKVLKIKIVSTEDEKVGLVKLLMLRYLPISVATLVPIAGSFLPAADALFIFRKDRRCVHDLIAGTRVIKIRA